MEDDESQGFPPQPLRPVASRTIEENFPAGRRIVHKAYWVVSGASRGDWSKAK